MAKKSSINFSDLSTWTIPLIFVVGCLIVIFLFIVARTALIDGVTEEVNRVDQAVKKEEQTYAKNQNDLALLPNIRKEVSELKLVRDEAKKYLPTEVSMPSLIDNVYLAARDNGIVFREFTPESDIDTKYYTIKPISLNAEVGYLSMAAFIEQVTTLQRIMNVQSVSFSENSSNNADTFSGSSNEPLRMTAQLRTYIFKESQSSN